MSIDILLSYACYSNTFFMFALSSQIDIVQLHAIRHFIIVLFVSTYQPYTLFAHMGLPWRGRDPRECDSGDWSGVSI